MSDASPRSVAHRPKSGLCATGHGVGENPQACRLDEIPQGYGKFGLTKTNPIPIFGIPGNQEYLDRLLTEDLRPITWKRLGCLSVENIEQMIDCYEIRDIEGEFITRLYLSPYHWRTSKKCPKGFILV